MYERLADFIIKNLNLERVSVILECGCGRGQLTLPFVKKVRKIKENFKVTALDISSNPYEGNLDILKERIEKEKLGKFVVAVKGDVRNMKVIEDESVDLIISNELFCELDRKGLEKAVKEFHRILKPNSQMAHGELNPIPENEAQRLVIEANAYSLETTQPKPEWFSPFSDETAALMHRVGFKNITVKYFETNVKMGFDTAMKKLKEWKTDPAFIEKRVNDLKKFGLELPMKHVIFCEKDSNTNRRYSQFVNGQYEKDRDNNKRYL
jgi:ubiquinone/menaquinone biosynthesis C-methylase UbiE